MKKPSLIIGKKQIILTCLTLMLAIAVYVNYTLGGRPEDALRMTAGSPGTDSAVETGADSAKQTYGDTQFVNGDAQATADYFAQARLEKQTSRDTAVQTLQSIIGGGDLTEDEAVTQAINAVELSRLVETEGNIESLIKAQGFADCVVYLDGESAKVVVQTPGLEPAQAAAIKDIILGAVTIPVQNIRIFEVK